ncbi:hypothetical protein V5799_029140 [Amblyomma americanum]|uniref:RNA-directed DNA polymerase n=1 Tax=Amblyomma americanum TaxID=6943 RepID=A0AAQ4ESC4_AMBAM
MRTSTTTQATLKSTPPPRGASTTRPTRDSHTRRSRDPTPRATCNARARTSDLEVTIDGRKVTALVDTGADYSVMNGTFAAQLRKVTTAWDGPQIRTAGGHLITPSGQCTARVTVKGHTYPATFVVLPQCSREVILGMDFLNEHQAIIDLRSKLITLSTDEAIASMKTRENHVALSVLEEEVSVPPRSSVIVTVGATKAINTEAIIEGNMQLLLDRGISIARGIAHFRNGQAEVLLTNFSEEYRHINRGTTIAFYDEISDVRDSFALSDPSAEDPPDQENSPTFDINPDRHRNRQDQIRNLLQNYSECFSTSPKVRQTPIAKHRIITDQHVRPLRQSPYRVSPRERQAIRDQVEEMLRDDVIQPSNSPWAAPVVLVRKKDGALRFCVDYRRLNNITKKDVYPLPRIDDTLDRLCNAKYFSSMDLKSGYWQIEVDERDREKTAFITPDGLFEFKVMPFGLCSAPATFQRVMDTVLAGLKWKICLVYLDDVVVFASNFEEHLKRLRTVLDAIKSSGLTLKAEKCHFAYEELLFLGHIVSKEGVRPDPQKTAAIEQFQPPADKKAVRRFLGLCAYYRRFVKNFSRIAEPLTQLTKADVPFKWEAPQAEAFKELQRRLQSPPILAHFDENADTEVHTDASSVGLGAVLVQKSDGLEKVIAYASRSLSKAEANYSTTEKECLAIIWATSKFRPYLYGRPFKVVSDHHALCWLANLKDPSGRLARWSLRLQEFDVTVVYKSGRKHTDADCLSRAPVDAPPLDDDEDAFLGPISASSFAQQQRSDPNLKGLIEYLEGKVSSPPASFKRGLSSFCVQNEVLVKKNFTANKTAYLLVVPTCLREEVLQASHDEPTAGHLGFTRTLRRIQDKYYWPRLSADVAHYVKTCRDCQRRKTPPTRPAGFLNPIEPPSRPFQQIGMDLLGPFPTSTSGNKWIIIATDYLTRYAEAKALPNGTAAEVAKFFVECILLRHGGPDVLITDRGTAFTAELTQAILRYSQTSHRRTTAYHPQTNGLTERLNKTIADMLAMYVDAEHTTWDVILPYVVFAYNTAVQETTQMTPFRLVHGRDATTTLDAMLPNITEEENVDVAAYLQRAEEARRLARLRIKDQQRSDARRYNLRRRNAEYKPGDQVWVWTPIRRRGLSEKLLRRYFGPYKVLRRLGELDYEVIPDAMTASQRRRVRPEVVHVVRLKPYYAR